MDYGIRKIAVETQLEYLEMKTLRRQLVTILLGLLVLGISQPAALAAAETAPLTTIASLDVPRYMGRWYEIAKFPNWFQRKCLGETRAEYSLKAQGTVQVINRCRMEGGEWNEAVGEARQIGGADSPKLEVRFVPAWLSFIPAVWGDYWVIDLDAAYQLVAVSEPRREYLWVLSRNPQVSMDAYDALLQRLRLLGFDTRKLETTVHGAGQ
jgi:apolipoprotein D and lipocalin family protein